MYELQLQTQKKWDCLEVLPKDKNKDKDGENGRNSRSGIDTLWRG